MRTSLDSLERRERAMRYLVDACDRLTAAHRARAAAFPFTTLNEESALSNLRLRLKEWDAATDERTG